MNSKLMFSSNDMTWETPVGFFNKLNKEFDFTLDVCATKETAKCEKFYSPIQNGLEQKWYGRCWMNPPYGREIGKWVKKAYNSTALVVCLLPSRTDTKWWHNYCMLAEEIRFVKGRIKFGNAKNGAPFPSVIVIFNRSAKNKERAYCPTTNVCIN